MLRELPTAVNIPFQAMADDGLLDVERLTLCVLYAYADDDGIVHETPMSLQTPRNLHKNTVRRHLYKLERLKYLTPINRATRLDRVPQRSIAVGYALTLRADGSRYQAAHPSHRIGSKNWKSRRRWE